MSTQGRDLAFNNKLWAYDIGQDGRQPKLVIRIASDRVAKGGSKNATRTLSLADDTGAGRVWTTQELNISEARKDEMVVIVGELLPESCIPKPAVTPNIFAAFDPAKHTIVPTSPDAVKVVRNLTDAKANLYILTDKRNGLCGYDQLPSRTEGRLVFYPEWISNPLQTVATARAREWRKQTTSFVEEFVSQHPQGFGSNVTSSELRDKQNFLSPFGCVRLEILKMAAAYGLTKSPRYLEAIIQRCRDARGREAPRDADEKQLSILRAWLRGDGHLDIEGAAGAVVAYTKIYSKNLSADVLATITTEAMLDLARGLRCGALADSYIEEGYYRSLVINFCFWRSKKFWTGDEQRKDAIEAAYHTAVATVHDPPPPPLLRLKLDDPASSVLTIIQTLERSMDHLIATIRSHIRAEEREFEHGMHDTPNHDFRESLAQLASVRDLAVANSELKHIAHSFHIRALLYHRELVKVLTIERDMLHGLVEDLNAPDQPVSASQGEDLEDHDRTSPTQEPQNQSDRDEGEGTDNGYSEYLSEIAQEDWAVWGDTSSSASEAGEEQVDHDTATDGNVAEGQDENDEDVDDVVHWKSRRLRPEPSWSSSKRGQD